MTAPIIPPFGPGGLLYLVYKNNELKWTFTNDNDLVTGFIKNYVDEEKLPTYAHIASVFNNPLVFTHFTKEIVSNNPKRWSNEKIMTAKSITEIEYYIQSGQWDKKSASHRLQKFCEDINNNNDSTIFKEYTIYFCYPEKTAVNSLI